MNKQNLKSFTNQYSLSKTLRFELIPQPATLEHIKKKGLLSQDEARAESYKEMKITIDAYHRDFIELAMSSVTLTHLQAFADLYYASNERKKEDSYKAKLEAVQTNLRKEIVKGFTSGDAKPIFSKLDKKELITQELGKWIESKNNGAYFDEGFKNFTTYFGGFHENRKNMYTDKEQSTAIAYRLIHENLPKFLDNINTFEKIRNISALHQKCEVLYKEIEEYLGVNAIDDAFLLDYYNQVLTQKGINVYNLIIGGRVDKEGQQKIQGLNEYINLYNQQQEKSKRIPKLKMLYKQILSDRLSDRGQISFMSESFENSQDVLEAIENYYKSNLIDFKAEGKEDSVNVLIQTKALLSDISSYEIEKIYIRNGSALNRMSSALFGDWAVIKNAMAFSFEQSLAIGGKALTAKQKKAKESYLDEDKQKYYSIAEIETALLNYQNETEVLKDLTQLSHPIVNYFHAHFKAQQKEGVEKEFDLIAHVTAKYSCIQGILNSDYSQEKRLNQDKDLVNNIKEFLDSLMEVLHFVKPLTLPKDSALEKDEKFYSQFEPYYDQLQLLIPLYNKVRNYVTQKPYSTEKFKLNFENSTLLNGWDANKEESNTAVLFQKESFYYLGIMDKNHNKIFRDIPSANSDSTYAKVNYKLLPGASKMLPKVFFSAKNIDYYNPSQEILDIRNHSSHTKGGKPQTGYDKHDFNVVACRKMIDFYKSSINKHPEWKNFGFKFSDTQQYDTIDTFYKEVESQGYLITYTNIDDDYINELVDQGKLYLFKIYNKDFSPYSKGKPNMHTLYWRALFDPKNLDDVVYKLNGEAEIFYRKKSIVDDKVIHTSNQPIDNKNRLNPKKQSTFDYDIIKDKRFTVDKFQFHVPITLNFKASGGDYINQDVLNYLKKNPDVNIIGLDRGERHLIYLTLINQKGEIIKQFSLNEIINSYQKDNQAKVDVRTDYQGLLHQKEIERDKARKSWGTIENIKELKAGYLSHVVHKIAQLMVEYNAIVVMEDLNFGFKRGRFKVEKQVYQKLEKMLIDKLNYLVFKDKSPDEIGGLYSALQLTNKFTSFQKLGKQSGFLFYVPAWNTSKIDPTTGFVNFFNTRYENVPNAKEFFNRFERIHYNAKNNYFEFSFDYNKFTSKAEDTKSKWTVCSYADRIITYRNSENNNQWDSKTIYLTQEFVQLLEKYNIQYENEDCIKMQISEQDEKGFFEKLLYLFKFTLQMRNSKSNSTKPEDDYLISPVMNETGGFYDSRNAGEYLPKDADANGAYHIAKKGLMWMRQINCYEGDDLKKLKFDNTNKGWLQFAQENVVVNLNFNP